MVAHRPFSILLSGLELTSQRNIPSSHPMYPGKAGLVCMDEPRDFSIFRVEAIPIPYKSQACGSQTFFPTRDELALIAFPDVMCHFRKKAREYLPGEHQQIWNDNSRVNPNFDPAFHSEGSHFPGFSCSHYRFGQRKVGHTTADRNTALHSGLWLDG